MTIGVDIKALAGLHTGVKEYTANLLSALIKIAPHIYFKLFLNSFKKSALEYDWLDAPNAGIYKFRIPNKIFLPLSRFLNIPKVDAMIEGADVFFSPHFFISSLSPVCRRVVTFHDLSFMRYPEFFSLKQNIWHRFQMDPKGQAEKADRIVCVSESTKADLVELFGIDSEKIEVIYSGIDRNFFNQENEETKNAVKKMYNLPDNYILFLGTLEPRKNIIGIIKAFELLSGSKKFNDYCLVLAGNKGWQFENVFKTLKRSPFGSKIYFLGPVPADHRKAIYQCAKLFIYPSFFEGFGFPPLEAMASGIPVVTSNTSSLPEVVGDSALTIDPYNVREIAEAMELLLLDEGLYRSYADKGRERAQLFSWEKTAAKTLNALDPALKQVLSSCFADV